LLHRSCPSNALDKGNDLVPKPSTINIIGAAFARALAKHPVRLHWLASNVNHLHFGFSVDEESRRELKAFLQQAHSLIARQINAMYQREGHLFAGKARFTTCRDDAAAEQQLFYALLNPVKDGLVERVADTPFMSVFEHLASGVPLRFWYIDYEAWWGAGGPQKKGNRLKKYLRWVELPLTPLPGWAELTTRQVRTRIRRHVSELEQVAERERKAGRRKVVGVAALYRLDPRSRPSTPRSSGPQPLCHASDKETRKAFGRDWRELLREYRRASSDYRQGNWEREFPDGTYPPPLVTIYNTSAL
jgi:hypothetical protein